MSWVRALVVWMLLMGAETLHGALRILVLAPRIGELRARQIGALTGSLLIFLICLATFRWLRAQSARALLGIGALWVVLTVLFEIVLGRLVFHFDWDRILADYDLRRGGLMGIGLVALLFIPVLVARLRGSEASA
jgi:hypothetical protein